MTSAVLAHGIWVDDLIVSLLVAAAYAVGVLRASRGARDRGGACPYCDAPPGEEVMEPPTRATEQPGSPAEPIVRCGRCGFRLAARLSASGHWETARRGETR